MEIYEHDNRIKESRSWIASKGDQDVNSENWRKDLDGHGTHVAYLLLQVAQVADVHIAQVFETRKDLEKPGMAARVHERIASVRHAIVFNYSYITDTIVGSQLRYRHLEHRHHTYILWL